MKPILLRELQSLGLEVHLSLAFGVEHDSEGWHEYLTIVHPEWSWRLSRMDLRSLDHSPGVFVLREHGTECNLYEWDDVVKYLREQGPKEFDLTSKADTRLSKTIRAPRPVRLKASEMLEEPE